ncbi:cupin-like domain-containing protein [Streptomyces xanthophaeus]
MGVGAVHIDEKMRSAGMEVLRIPSADVSDPEELRRAVGSGRPMLFRGLASHWPAVGSWTPEQLKQRYPDVEVNALIGLPSSGVLFPQDQREYERTLSFSRFVDTMMTASPAAPCYLAYKRAGDLFDPSDYDVDSLTPDDGYSTDTRVWIGSAGTRSMLHSDLKDNFFCQIWGEKRVTLLPWRDSRAAYPFPDNLVNSRVDLADADLDRFPRLRGARFHHASVGPGDVLFIPRGCWHDIRSTTPSISVNHWFGKPQGVRAYLRLLGRLGPAFWYPAARDFVRHGVLGREERTTFFFSPPSTGKRLYDAVRWGDFSRDNDPHRDS